MNNSKIKIKNNFNFDDKNGENIEIILDYDKWREMIRKCDICLRKIDVVKDLAVRHNMHN